MSDNGGEFNNEGYWHINEKLNIETCTTAVESPFSNNTVECHNLIVAEAMEKTLEDEKCETEIPLARAVSAKNALHNHLDNGPNELVFGFDINTQSVLTNQLPAIEAATTSEMIRTNLNALHSAKKSFIEAEPTSEMIRTNLNALHSVRKSFIEAESTSEMIRTNLNALHSVRKSFIEAESSEKNLESIEI